MGFSSDWLALREPVDYASRDADLLARAKAVAATGGIICDLGSGTGSTARAFGDTASTWRFVDGDAALLDVARGRRPDADCVRLDLRHIDQIPLDNVRLVTASALLDLMPRDWIIALAARLQMAAIPFYGALSYDGIMHWSPPHHDDASVTEAFNTHQRTDKGIGPALGPDAAQAAAQIFQDAGFEVHQATSPWTLGAPEAELHRQLVQGIADAAAESGLACASQWGADRQAQAVQSIAHIGHIDILALPQRNGG